LGTYNPVGRPRDKTVRVRIDGIPGAAAARGSGVLSPLEIIENSGWDPKPRFKNQHGSKPNSWVLLSAERCAGWPVAWEEILGWLLIVYPD
jgi:hypothetical protein